MCARVARHACLGPNGMQMNKFSAKESHISIDVLTHSQLESANFFLSSVMRSKASNEQSDTQFTSGFLTVGPTESRLSRPRCTTCCTVQVGVPCPQTRAVRNGFRNGVKPIQTSLLIQGWTPKTSWALTSTAAQPFDFSAGNSRVGIPKPWFITLLSTTMEPEKGVGRRCFFFF